MKVIKLLSLLIASLVTMANASGNLDNQVGDGAESSADERPSVAVTQWTDQMELFMEYPAMVASEPARFIIHLTLLDDFQPVRDGRVSLSFLSRAGDEQIVTEDQLLREGIFAPTVTLKEPGAYDFILSYDGPGIRDSFLVENFTVYIAPNFIPSDHQHDEVALIGFLKEQQWKIPFATARAETREIKRSVWAVGHVMPSPGSYVEVIAPVYGVVHIANGDNPALPGAQVSRGHNVALITAPLQGDGWTSARLDYGQAERDYQRAQRLRSQEAISDRDFEAIENTYLTMKAGFTALSGGGTDALELHAPMDGRVIEWNLKPGQRVSPGDKLMAIADPRTVWLQVNVYERDFNDLGTPVGALIKSGSGDFIVEESAMHVLSSGGALDPDTRSVPVLLQIDNSSGVLKINQTVSVELYTSDGIWSTAVPVGSIYEDEGLDVVFVQAGGEAFEKRVITRGPRYQNWVAILDGIQPGERVVTAGGYHVKLASTSAEIGHGHAH